MAAYTTIDDPEAYFQTVIYTGNGAANHAITLPGDTAMQPDFVWIKNRDAADSNCLFDAVRGATKVLHSDNSDVEVTDTDTLDSFTSDGFQVDADVKVNTNTENYVAWCWKAGTTSGITTTNSDITPSAYSFNQTSGFSILDYTGTGVLGDKLAHGLGAAPSFFVTKAQDVAGRNWHVYHKGVATDPETDYMELNNTIAAADDASVWNDTAPDSVNMTLGTQGDSNADARVYIAYTWTPIQGFSKFGSYVGNGNADGPFVYTGFRPQFVLTKIAVGATEEWWITDNKRNTGNPNKYQSNVNNAAAELSNQNNDNLSNGFKIRTTNVTWNTAGYTYIYAAFAEAPFVNSNGVPCNAR